MDPAARAGEAVDDVARTHARVKTLFNEVCDLDDPAAQQQRLEALEPDPALRSRVLTMLAADRDEATGFSAPLAALKAAALEAEAPELRPGDRLGAWTLSAELGHGGMGRVYLAERSDGHYRQRAAIKLLLGWSTPDALAQLARERQILASLNHPHIARLIDGGTTPRGRPYLVMEYVDGQRIDRYCDEQGLGLDARLGLFEQVCNAVAHAHRQLIVHCDIKPGNVLVGTDGRAMLLDFGIAHLDGQDGDGPGASAGLTRQPLQKMGWLCSDTALLHFDSVRVPASHLLGEEGAGFRIIMGNFNAERFGMSAAALGFSQACYDEALAWARQRKTFGAALVERQVIRHKLVDMQMRIHSTAAWLEQMAARADTGDTGPDWVAQVCLLKNHSTQTMQFCADQAVQILGGMGFMRGTVSERIYREVKVMMIGGGAEEIMKDLAARQWGL